MFTGKKGLPDESTKSVIYVSKYTTLNAIVRRICEVRSLKTRSVRIWLYETEKECSLLIDLDKTLFDEAIPYGQVILFEKQIKLGVWPRDKRNKPKKSLVSKCMSCLKSETVVESSQTKRLVQEEQNGVSGTNKTIYTKGVCGLRNLGNTCFMNSSLQCLSNAAPLRDYFINDIYKDNINKNNPIGMKGNVAEQFGNVLKSLWSGQESYISPRLLKQTIAKWAPQFEGYNQHDSQELLAFLLDGLHEDLNQVSKKPYVEVKEAAGRPDDLVADEAWEGHLMRNRSIIVDLFHGQLKSTVTCPVCQKVSVTFDPFMYLSLPLSQESERYVETLVIKSRDASIPTKKLFKVAKGGFVAELREQVAKYLQVRADNIVLAEVHGSKVTQIFEDDDLIYDINNLKELFAYQLSGSSSKLKTVRLYHRTITGVRSRHFGFPLVMDICDGMTGRDLYNKVWSRIYKYCCLFEESSDEEEAGEDSLLLKDLPPIKRINKTPPGMTLQDYNHFPFKLKIIKKSGGSWTHDGFGYPIFFDDEPIRFPKYKDLTISIDWEPVIMRNNLREDEFDSYIVEKEDKENEKSSRRRSLDITECLSFFTSNERLGPNDPWYCSNCKEHQRAWKKFDIWKLPKILVVHLKRFHFTQHSRSKLNYVVNFPIKDLDLDKFVINPKVKGVKYDLFAVSNHSGSLSGGHYTAYAKNSSNDQWYSFNDSHVSKLKNEASIVSNSVYTLFYQMNESS